MKNSISTIFLFLSLLIYANPVPNPVPISTNIIAAPETSSATITINEGSTTSINLSDYSTVSGSDSIDSFTIVSQPVQKSTDNGFVHNGNGNYTYIHNGSEAPTDSFTFKATNADGDSNTSTISFKVTNVNDAPTIAAIDKTVNEGSSVEITAIGKDAENAELTYSFSNASSGTVTKDAVTGIFTYKHDGSDTISDSFTITATEIATTNTIGALLSGSATVSITVTPVNDAPVTVASIITVNEGASFNSAFNATDSDSSTLKSSITTQPTNGTVLLVDDNPLSYTYTSDGSEVTGDQFTYNISDGALSSSSTITVIVNSINDAPTANADTYYISGEYVVTKPGVGLLRNDIDPENNDMTVAPASNPTAGTIALNADGTFTYTPSADAVFQTDSFTYIASDSNGAQSAPATVTFTAATLIPVPDTYNLTEGQNLQVGSAEGILANDVDTNTNFTIDSVWVQTAPKFGTLSLTWNDGSFAYQHDGSETRADSFEYKVKNSNGDLSESTFVSLFSENVNDAPTTSGTAVTLNEGAEKTFALSYTDSDTNIDSMEFNVTSNPSNGTIIRTLGTIRYIHNGSETTSDTFNYTVGDGQYTTSDVAVSLTITAVNDLPTAAALSYTVAEGGTLSAISVAGTDVETNDSSLTFKLETAPSNGTVTISDAGVWSYTHSGTETSSDSFTYSANDGTANGTPAAVAITVTAVNSSPVTTAVSIALNEGANATYDISTNTTDSDTSSGITYIVTSVPSYGALTDPNNSGAAVSAGTTLAGSTLTYTHNGGETTSDSFKFKANDGASDSNISVASVAVTAVNDAPSIDASTAINVNEKDKVDITILGSDVDSSTLTYTIVTAPTSGNLTGSDGNELTDGNTVIGNTVTYTSVSSISSNATDSFVVKANDGTADSANATINIAITAIDESKPQVIIEVGSSSVSEDVGTVSVTASLISNTFYSPRRDMNTTAVSANATNALGYVYLGDFGGHKYYLKQENNTSNSEAKADALAKGGYLVTLETEAEETWVKDKLSGSNANYSQEFWIGLNYKLAADAFQWINGSTYSATESESSRWYDTNFPGNTNNQENNKGVKYDRDWSGWQNTTETSNLNGYIIEFDNSVNASQNTTVNLTYSGSAQNTGGDSTADSGDDWTISANLITIANGSSSASVTITIVDDNTAEGTEPITITATSADAGVAIVKGSKKIATVNVQDNELAIATMTTSAPIVSGSPTATEGTNATVDVTATLDFAKAFDSSIGLAISGSATLGSDFSSSNEGYVNTLSFNGMSSVRGVVVDASGNYYVGDRDGRFIWKMTPGGTVTSIGSGDCCDFSTSPSTGSSAKFRDIKDMAIDGSGKIYFTDGYSIRILDPSNERIYYVAGANSGVSIENVIPSGGDIAISTDSRFSWGLRGITVNTAGTIIYVTDENMVRKIYSADSDNIIANSAAEDFTNIKVVNVNQTSDWGRSEDGDSAASAKFEGPRSIGTLSNGDIVVGDYYGIKKLTVGSESSAPKFYKVVQKEWSEKEGLVVDSSDNIYFSAREDNYIYKYVSSTGSLVQVIDTEAGTVDGVTATAQISQPKDIALHSNGNLVFVQNNDQKVREIDFASKIRIPSGQTTGTFTLNVKDESFYESNETIQFVATGSGLAINTKNIITVSSVDYLSFDSTTTKTDNATDGTNGIVLASDDNAPTVQVLASEANIAENGGVSTVSFTIGGASESGTKMDLDDGLKEDFPFIGTYQDHKYYIAQEWLTWDEALARATALGGYLLTISSEAENTWVKDNLGDNKWDSYWLGYNDKTEEGTFVWANGSDSAYTNWGGNEPNNAGDEDVVEFSGYNGTWNDLSSNDGRFFIIEFSGTISAKDVVIPYLVTASTGFETASGTDATYTTSGNVTIPAGQSKYDLTVTAVQDDVNEITETLTYTITDAITDGTYDAPNSVASVSIIDDEDPAVTWASSAGTFSENGGSVVITATADVIKTTDSKLNLTITDNGATKGEDYSISELQKVGTFAGSTSGFKDGTGSDAKFNDPSKITTDAAGNIYVADSENMVVRKITPSGVVTTYAGNGDWAHDRETGNKMDVGFARPSALAFNNAGDELFIIEQGRNRISKIDASGNVSLVSGNGDWGQDDGDKKTAKYRNPFGLTFDSAGNLYVVDDQIVRKLVVDGSGNWTVSAFAGKGDWGMEDGTGTDAGFKRLSDLVIDKSGSDDVMYVADENRIRKITIPGAVVTTYANTNDNWGEGDGTLQSASFRNIKALSIDLTASSFTMYASDESMIRKISAQGVETLTEGGYGYQDGIFSGAKFKDPRGLAITSSGIYISDTENNKIRKIDLLPSITIPAGSATGSITINGIDDQLFESATEAFKIAVSSVVNVDVSESTYADISTIVTSDDAAPTIKLSANDDYVDENGGSATLTVSLADAFSSAKSDMNASNKADFYYLGEYNGSKYYASKDDDLGRKSYSDALSGAAALGGQLAVITSAGENDFITGKLYEEDPGYNTVNREWLNHWIGHEYDLGNTKWTWTNSAQSDYTNWGWDYNADYIDRYYSKLRYRGMWFNEESYSNAQYIVEFSSAISDIDATATITFTGSGATDGTDYTTSVGAPDAARTVTIGKGQPSTSITITGVDDSTDEAIETIVSTMTAPQNALIGADSDSNPINNAATIQISDNELPAVTLSLANTTINEVAADGVPSSTTLTATIVNAKLNAVDLSVDFTSSGAGIAVFGNDFGSDDLNRVTTLAGDGNDGYLDGDADEAEFSDDMKNAAVDSSGNVYIADRQNHVIRKITPSGEVSTFAGNGQWWNDGDKDQTDGDKLDRSLRDPVSVKFDNDGNMFVVEPNAHRISKITMSSGVLSRYVGLTDDQGDNNGNDTEAKFNRPQDIAFDSSNNMYVLDRDNTKIRKVVNNGTNRIVTDYAGNGNYGQDDGPALEATIEGLKSMVIDSAGNIFFTANDRIRMVSANGATVSTVAGQYAGYSDGFGTNARFSDPRGLAIDGNNNIYVADANNSMIRKISDITHKVKVTTISGTGDYDYSDGTQDEAAYRSPRYVAYGNNALYVVDSDDNRIRKVQLTPKMTIPAGQNSVTYNISSINDVVYENDETIKFTSSTVTGGTYSGGEVSLILKSDELTPKIQLNAESLVLDEAAGTITLEVSLTDAAGASSNWENTDLPSEASSDYEYMGEFEGHKYYFSRYGQSWLNAKQNALDLGGQLLVIDSQDENDFVNSIMIKDGTWLGTKRANGDAAWTNIYGSLDFENFADDIITNGYGYAVTWGNEWYDTNNDNEYRNYIVEYGPVTTSELNSTVDLLFADASTATKGDAEDGTADYKASATSFSIPAGSQTATVTLTGLQDTNEEPIENILLSIANPGNVDLGAETSLEIKISDDEAPVITFVASKDSISENGGSVVLTANLSNPKLNPTTINLGLQGTSTALDDYNVSSIFKYSNFAGSKDNFGSANGIGSQARFDEPIYITSYLNGSMLVSDRVTHTIRLIAADGTVSTIVGKPNSCGGDDSGLASDVRICSPGQIAVVNDGSGKFIFHTDSRIYMYDPDFNGTGVKMVIELQDGMDRIGGLALNSNILYVSQRYRHTVLAIDMTDGSSSVIIGQDGSYKNGDWFNHDPIAFNERSLLYPGMLLWDNARNQLYINSAGIDWMEYWDGDGLISVANFTSNTVSSMSNVTDYYYDDGNSNSRFPSFRAMDLDADGNLYVPVSNRNTIAKVNFTADGIAYVSFNIKDNQMYSPASVAYSNGSLFLSNYDGPTIDKIGLGASIEIPAMQTTNNITLEAFKDPWFEEDETIDVKVSSLVNGTVASNDVDVVTIVESTRLTLVADAPFEGVENGKVSWGDYDKDGDMDLALMGSASTGTITNVYKNNNGVFENTNQNFTKFIGGDIEFVDVNQDGFLDVAVSGFAEGNIRKSELYINQEGAFFELMENYDVRGLSQVDMEWGDLDNDGDPDLIISGIDQTNQFMTLYYTNLGDFNFLQEGLFYDFGVINGEIDIVDADQDGDNDLFTNGTGGSVTSPQFHSNFVVNTYYREGYDEQGNNNSNNPFNVGRGYKNGNTIYSDIDGDGELDYLAIGEDTQGNVQTQSNLSMLNSILPTLKNVDFDFADYNNDGQSDLILTGEDVNSGAAVTKLYTTFPAYFGAQYGLVDSQLAIAGLRSSSTYWIDYDKDGDLDLFLTGLDDQGIAKSLLYKAENTNNLNSAPAKIENLSYTHDGLGTVEFKWDKPTDNISSSFRYDIRIGTTSGASDVAYANSNTTTGSTLINIPSLSTLNDKEVILNPGTYFVSVQAIDGGNMGGIFSDEITFTLDYEWKQLNLGGVIDRRLLPTETTQLEFLDMDGDGDKDLISTNLGMRPMGSANNNKNQNKVNQRAINIYAFDNEVFKPVMDEWWGVSNFELGDFNNDGEKDIILAVEEDSGTRVYVLLNTRLKDDAREDDPNTNNRNEGLERDYFEIFNPFINDNNFLESIYNIEFAIKDLDNDGLVEVIAAGQSSKLTNEATTIMSMVSVTKESEDQELGFNKFKFSESVSVVDAEKLSSLSFASYDFGDIDNDGDFDFLISGYSFDGYKTILFENKRKKDADGVTIQPIEVYFEEKDQSFVSVKSGTADFVDFDADGKLDILFSGQSASGDLVKAYKNGKDTDGDGKVDEAGYFDLDVGLPAVREGKFVFGDFDSNGFADVVYSGTVSGVGKVTKMVTWSTVTNKMVESVNDYDLSYYQDANIGVGDFDGDKDADLLITGKNQYVNDINSDFQYISDVFINVRGFAGPGDSGIANDDNGYREGTPLKKSIGVKKTYGLNARPFPPTEVNFQRSRLGAVRPNEDDGGNKTSTRSGAADDSNDALFELVITWSGAVDTAVDGKQTPAEGLTYSVRIGSTAGGEEILASGSDIDGVKVAADKGNAENNLSWKVNVPQGEYYVSVQSIDASFIGSTFSPEQKYTVTSAFKLGDSNGDDGINILDLTTNLDYILGNNPKVFVQEVADVNNDGKIDVTDISAIVNLILNGEGGVANGSNYDPYDWDYFSDKPVGDATLVHTDNRIYLENDKPVTSLQFSMDATVEYELSEALNNMSVVSFVNDGMRTFLIYSYNNQPINELTNVVFDYIDVNENDDFEIVDLRAGTNDGLVLDLKYSDERFFDSLDDSVQMYPNPASSNINLLTDVKKNVERLDVNIYNVLGVSVYNISLDSMGRLNDLDVSMLSSGIYTVQVKMITKDNEEIVSVHKLIKK